MFGPSVATSETKGDPVAEFTCTIQYCGGWGYLKYATEIQQRVDAKYPGKVNYKFNKDAGTTGNLEVNI